MALRPWLAEYPSTIPHSIDPDTYESLVALFRARVAMYTEEPAFTNEGTTLTFGDVDRFSAAFAAFLSAQKSLRKGDRIAVMLPNLLQSPIAIIGVLRAGMVVVNVNPQYTPRELQHQLNDSGAKAIVVLENFAHTLARIVGETNVDTVITTSVGDQHPILKRWLIDFA
ncbi:MAG: AMP-binding protein, partial [Gammaproteobacteria bacterium]